MLTVVCRLDLGVTRIAGYTLYDTESLEFRETTVKETRRLIESVGVNGLRLGKDDIELDAEDWGLVNLMIKSGVGKYRDWNSLGVREGNIYQLVHVIETNLGTLYELVTHKCSRMYVNGNRLKMLTEYGIIGGMRIVNQEIVLCSGVKIEDKREEGVQQGELLVGFGTSIYYMHEIFCMMQQRDISNTTVKEDATNEVVPTVDEHCDNDEVADNKEVPTLAEKGDDKVVNECDNKKSHLAPVPHVAASKSKAKAKNTPTKSKV